jgi:DNA-binding transcriptional ArsR family regulator
MSDEKIDEETYSVIYSSLKHPIRRKILRMLDSHDCTYSEMLEALAIDSGHLGYHLENLGDLITHLPSGKYGLSTFGKAAVTLMSGVEEPNRVSKPKRARTLKLLSIGLAALLLIMSVYAVTFTNSTQSSFNGQLPYSNSPLMYGKIAGFTLNITNSPILTIHDNTYVIQTNGLFNVTTYTYNYDNPNVHIVDEKYGNTLDVMTKYKISVGIIGNQTVFPISLQIYDKTGKALSPAQNKTSENNIIQVDLGEFSQLGTYKIEEAYKGSEPLGYIQSISIVREQTQKPMFYYGLLGIIVSILYLIITLTLWSRAKKNKR